jgi:NADH-quinone oxidoreductase subunit A
MSDFKLVPAPDDPVAMLVFFLLVFTIVGVIFLFIHLFMGSFIRPRIPDAEKLTIYECGEPTVGSAWIQFDLRFYVVALLFVIFDVEVAFFFPWATVFGKANQLSNENITAERRLELSEQLMPSGLTKEQKARLAVVKKVPKMDENGRPVTDSKGEPVEEQRIAPISASEASTWAFIAFWDIIVFFAVLMVGFAYVWRRGDIDWVRAYAHHQEPPVEPEKPVEQQKVA